VIPLNVDAMAALARLLERAHAHGDTHPEHFVFPACENERIDSTRPQKSWRTAWRFADESGWKGGEHGSSEACG
jgi:hypothetical protein